MIQTEVLIRAVIQGCVSDQKEYLEQQINNLRQSGVSDVILGCTELSMIMRGTKDTSLIDPLRLVVQAIFQKKDRL